MENMQNTLAGSATFSGVGLHTGQTVNITLNPAEENHGIKFQRTDLEGQPIIAADVDYVTDTSRGTTLELNGAKVATCEHLLAAVSALEIDNILIQLDGDEIPILDGSAKPFYDELKKIGTKEQDAERQYIVIDENINFRDEENGVEMTAMPLDDYRLTVMVDYNSPVLGSQHASITSLNEFEKEIASCRTFCFLHELEILLDNNLIKGGDLDNAIVIVDREVEQNELDRLATLFNKPKVEVKKEGILNNVDLRFQNEPARHKLLDLIGDLTLIGRPIKAQIMAARPGHASNVAFAKKIKAFIKEKEKEQQLSLTTPKMNPDETPIYDHSQVAKIMPHKFPFLLVDKIVKLTENEVWAVKNISGDQYFFQGHFPSEPIMPGVLQLEAMAQAGGVLVLHDKDQPENWSTYFLKIENAKFKGKVVPGDSLMIKMKLVAPIRRGVCMMRGEAYVGSKLVTEADMVAQIVENKG